MVTVVHKGMHVICKHETLLQRHAPNVAVPRCRTLCVPIEHPAPSTQHHQVVSDLFPAAPLRSLVPLQSRVTKVDRYHRIKLIHAREIRCANDIRMLAR